MTKGTSLWHLSQTALPCTLGLGQSALTSGVFSVLTFNIDRSMGPVKIQLMSKLSIHQTQWMKFKYPINQSINQSTNQLINQSIYQSIYQSICQHTQYINQYWNGSICCSSANWFYCTVHACHVIILLYCTCMPCHHLSSDEKLYYNNRIIKLKCLLTILETNLYTYTNVDKELVCTDNRYTVSTKGVTLNWY